MKKVEVNSESEGLVSGFRTSTDGKENPYQVPKAASQHDFSDSQQLYGNFEHFRL